jgi:HAD superfamily hydrolase (TIGR01509 family)
MAIDAVVFDLDGLMFNTEIVFNEVGHEILRRRGKQMTRELIDQMMGRRAHEAIQIMIDLHQLPDTVHELAAESQILFFELARDRLAPMPGLLTLLDRIEQRGLPRAVATSSARPYMERILREFQLLDRFQATLTAEDVTHGKPSPEIYLAAAQVLGVEPTRMLVLEDSQNGTNAAAAAGAVIVSIPQEHSLHQDFGRATFVSDRLDDPRVLALLG